MGFGTWIDFYSGQSPELMRSASLQAVRTGYRHFDLAFTYQTEAVVLESVLGSVPRSQVYLTQKGYTVPARLSTPEYWDLFLLHGPPRNDFRRELTVQWRRANDLLRSQKVLRIGVSNFYRRQLEILLQICDEEGLMRPTVNQIELHPFNQEWSLVDYCNSEGIQVTAHSPLGGQASQFILQNDTIQQLAEHIGSTPAQAVLAATMARGIPVIPRSLRPERIVENYSSQDFIAEITPEDLMALRQLDVGQPFVDVAVSAKEFDLTL